MRNKAFPALPLVIGGLVCSAALLSPLAQASSHREAPGITKSPKVDGTDFYMFRSYESGREGFVTLIANYLPLQDAYGGPNYFSLDPDAVYEIHIDNDGDANEDITFQFKFNTELKGLALTIGDEGATKSVAVPLLNIGGIGPGAADTASLNQTETFTLNVIRGDRRTGTAALATNMANNGTNFRKPMDYIGTKSFSDYGAYADNHIWNVGIPGCDDGKVFVGQRKESFAVNLGETFDLINTNPLGPVDGEANTLADKNVTSLALEVPIACLTNGNESVIGGWTTASLPQARVLNPVPQGTATTSANPSSEKPATVSGGSLVQVSRLGNPLVNEVVIGVPDKNRFNASEPNADTQFLDYVSHPTLPELIEILFPVEAPNLFPRTDLISIFLTGVDTLNKPANGTPSEVLRLNTSIAAADSSSQNNLGVVGGDNAGFPNGRRPGDDVVDIALRAVMGVLLTEEQAPNGQLAYTDGATISAAEFRESFPYLNTPIPGAVTAASSTE